MEVEQIAERPKSDWKLYTVFPSGELSKTWFTFKDMEDLGYKIVKQLDEVVFMANFDGGVECFVLSKYFDV